VIHSGRAAVAEGSSAAFLTVAGDEPEARAGLRTLAGLGTLIHQSAPATTTYAHDERDGRRVLRLEAASDAIAADARLPASPGVVLLAPIAGELPPATVVGLRARLGPTMTVLLLQGWLRRLDVGRVVDAIRLDAVAADVWSALSDADAIVLSTEDLAESLGDPFAQAAAVRRHVGAKPVVVLTLGVQGYLLDDPEADEVTAVMPRRVVVGAPTVGAGDTFGVVFAIHLARGSSPAAAASAAGEAVIRLFEARLG
jgi:sugar/nucleoside kinase (ribokinase family)